MMRAAACLVLVLATSALADAPEIDAMEALAAAKLRGVKRSIIVSDPIPCPAVASTEAQLGKLRATGDLAPFVLSIDTFLREDFGVAEAVALLGENVLCSRFISTYRNYELAPRGKGVYAVSLELYDDTLIGVMIELEQPIDIDVAKLAQQYGPPRQMPGIHRAREGTSIAVASPGFRGSLMFRADHADASKFRSVMFRRTPAYEILPEKFVTADDVARLVKLVVRAPEPSRFYGSLGVFDKASSTVDRDVVLPAVAMRNVANASITHVAYDERCAVKRIEVTFATPITGDLAKALGTRLELLGVTFDGTRLVVERR